MPRTINRVILLGYLGKDPELRTFENGAKMVSFTLATNDEFTKDGEKKRVTDWHRIIVWGYPKSPQDITPADIVLNYFSKGDGAYIEGKLKPRRWEKGTVTEVVATTVVKVEKPEKDDQNPYGAP